jgi:hypothetical protein
MKKAALAALFRTTTWERRFATSMDERSRGGT